MQFLIIQPTKARFIINGMLAAFISWLGRENGDLLLPDLLEKQQKSLPCVQLLTNTQKWKSGKLK